MIKLTALAALTAVLFATSTVRAEAAVCYEVKKSMEQKTVKGVTYIIITPAHRTCVAKSEAPKAK